MDDPGGSTYFLAVFCLALSAIFSGSESILFSSDQIKLKSAFAGDKRLSKVLALKEDPYSVLSGLLLGNTLVNITFAFTVSRIVVSLSSISGGLADLVATLVGTVLLLLFGEITPKFIGTANPESFLMFMSSWLNAVNVGTKPFSAALHKLGSWVSAILPKASAKAQDLSQARLLAAVDFGETSGAIRNDEKQMIHGVIDSRGLEAVDVMVPRPNMVCVQEDTKVSAGLEIMLRHGFSRIPIFQDIPDNITGIVNIKDLVELVGSDELAQHALKEFATPPYFVPETKKVGTLLHEMKSTGIHMSIVVDEFDGVSGLVTLEDLIEEIVGDIQDEYDINETGVMPVDDGWEAPGRISLSDLESFTGVALDMDECDSLAGVVMKSLDKMPEKGDVVRLEKSGVCLTVKDVKGPKVQKILVQILKGRRNQ